MFWAMFVLWVANGEVHKTVIPVKDQATCEALKADVTKELIKEYPANLEVSLSCFEVNKLGKPA